MMRFPTSDWFQETSDKLRPYASYTYAVYVWVFVLPIMLVITLLLGIACLATVNFLGPKRAGRLYAPAWAKSALFLGGIKVDVRGLENIPHDQSVVIVSNHLSHIDILVLYGKLPMDFRWVMKQELRKVPIIGICCEKLGHIFIDRGHHANALASLEQAKKDIHGGTSVIFFAEGTRNREGKLQAFKKGAFHMATDLNLPVLPVSITGTQYILPAKTLRIAHHHATMTILPLLPQPENDAEPSETLRQQSHQVIAASLSGNDQQTT